MVPMRLWGEEWQAQSLQRQAPAAATGRPIVLMEAVL
jgi:hypothetical protein